MKAYVLVNTELGQEAAVVEELSVVPGISGAHSLYGIYDVIVEVEAETMEKVKEIVFNHHHPYHLRQIHHTRLMQEYP
jgi:DNA-binding Lrp family transcriptional regulator